MSTCYDALKECIAFQNASDVLQLLDEGWWFCGVCLLFRKEVMEREEEKERSYKIIPLATLQLGHIMFEVCFLED